MSPDAVAARILGLLDLADEDPTHEELEPYLADPAPEVRRNALGVLSDHTEDWTAASPVFAAALTDEDPAVRAAATRLVRELSEVLVPGEEFDAALRRATTHADATVRLEAIDALWRHRLTTVDELTGLSGDPDAAVRCEVVLGFVSLDALDALARAADDPDPSVRLAVARGLGAVGDPRGTATLTCLAADPEFLVRAAALTAMARTGCGDEAVHVAVAALTDDAWEVRQGAANALSSAAPDERGAAALVTALGDENLDVRKAAVKTLGAWLPSRPAVRSSLESALSDVDADVRAYARMSLTN
ncbi:MULTISPECIES: HEAT repeat domain-containing protein [Pseudonocardia]|uniref:HEAT repeat domain-containing protein n=1 Tax=Pseudonocardia TaxID=1847 RepID=UPI001930B765|nr:HEAT repeat domain-containing protein [Pseudonocardia dioxanivorans]